MTDIVGSIIVRFEAAGSRFSELAYGFIGSEIAPILHVSLVAYVALYGIQLLLGTSTIGLSDVIMRVVRMAFIVTLAGNWRYFDELAYTWLTNVPERIGKSLLEVIGTGISQPTIGLTAIWKTSNEAASAFARQTGYLVVLPSLVGWLLMANALILLGIAVALLLLTKVMTWALVGTAPVFIACMLFVPTRNLARAWLHQVLLYATIPIFLYVVLGFLIVAIEPELIRITDASDKSALKLSDIAGFLILCAAGSVMLVHVFLFVRSVMIGIVRNTNSKILCIPNSTPLRNCDGKQKRGYSNRFFVRETHLDTADRSAVNLGVKEAMQNRISSNGLPH